MKYLSHLFFVFLFLPGLVLSQEISVTGKVTSASDGLPVIGVSVLVKGTTEGTVTNISGDYTISCSTDAILVFSFVGMKTQEIRVGGRVRIDVVLEDEVVGLGELVVVGYSTSSRKLITGAVGTVGAEDIRDIPLKTIEGVLQGKESGLVITQNSGTPGGQMSIRLRGGSSINAGNDPLVVIDGIPAISGNYGQVPFSGQRIDALNNLTPGEIESVTVLKDASATAIYGARASNGVILITTKKGSRNQFQGELTATYGWQALPGERKLEMLNAEQWNEYKGTNVQNIDTDWLDEILQTAPIANIELGVSGGTEKLKTFIGGGFFDQGGILKGTSFTRYNGRLNMDYAISKKVTVGGGVGMAYSHNERVEGDQSLNGPLPNSISQPPIYPVYDSAGNYDESGPYANSVAIANEAVNNADGNTTNGNVYLEWKIINGLSFNTKWGVDIYNLREHSYDPPTTRQGSRYNGLGLEGTSYVSNLVSNNLLQYAKTFGEKHGFDILLGNSFEKYHRSSTYIEGIDFPDEQYQNLASAATIREASVSTLDRALVSFFGQLKYNFEYKYMVTLTARADGSSKFGENNRYGFFPAFSVAWRISEEDFFKGQDFISELKIRAGAGQTGNDGIPDFASLGLYGGGANYGQESGIYPVQLANPDLKWETTNHIDVGIDMTFWRERLNLTFDLYYNKTKDLLLATPLPPSSGFYSIYSNIGELENKGVEMTFSGLWIDSRFKWSTSVNIAANRNKVTRLYNDAPIDDIGRGGNRIEVGEPLGIFYGYNMLGVDPSTGNIVYEDINGDGSITSNDRVKTGDPNPRFSGGLTNTFTLGSFELNIFLQYMYGNDIYNGTRIYIEAMTGEDNQTTAALRRWRKPGDITDVPRIGDTYKSSRFIEDGSFLRIKNVSLSYRIPARALGQVRIRTLRIFVTGQNLFTFTKYSGMDPEVNYLGDDNLVRGTDFFTYPQARSISFGLSLGF